MFRILACSLLLLSAATSAAPGQAVVASPELQRFQGRWRVTELIDDGQPIPESAFKDVLQSGGVAEIVSNTILFRSPNTGERLAKVFTIDATTYPKAINVSTLDRLEGTGIYQFDGERLVLCFSDPAVSQRPTQFSSRPGSKHMLMVLQRAHDNENLAASSAASAAAPQSAPSAPSATAAPASAGGQVEVPAPKPKPAQVEAARPQPEVTKVDLPAPPASAPAARVLTDAEVTTMLRGGWRIRDGVGVLQVYLDPNGTYRSYREVQDPSSFYKVFVQAPVAAGSWSVRNGNLEFRVTSSTDPNRVGQVLQAAVRSVSQTDLIIVDPWGRVVQAAKLQ